MCETIKTSDGRIMVLNTPDEDRAITEAALADLDALPLTDEDIAEIEKQLRERRKSTAGDK
jgi:hypothetical protein